jgi:hypothetical protein
MIEASTNLIDWVALPTIRRSQDGSVYLETEMPSVPKCFYRAALVY